MSGGTTSSRSSRRDLRAGADGERGHALPPLHLRHDRQTEGHPAHHRRLSARRQPRPTAGSSTCKDDDIYWAAADIGWVTGHSYIVYGPLANGATGVMYEGTPDFPIVGALVGDHRAVQGHDPLHRADRDPRPHEAGRRSMPTKHDLSSLRAARHGRRADQPRGVDLVPRAHRRRAAARSSTPGGRPKPARS